MKVITVTILCTLALLVTSCNNEDGLNSEVPSFSKLYYAADNIEANDFIEKEDGYLILATIFTTTQSDFFLINTDAEGYVIDTTRVGSSVFDKGITLKRNGNEVFILGVSSNSPLIPANTGFRTLVFKTDLNGIPIKAPSDTTSNNATLQTLNNRNNYSMKMNDFIISDDKIVFGGTLYNNNNTGEIVQIYGLDAIGSNSTSPIFDDEFPNDIIIDNTNTTILRVFKGFRPDLKFTTIGQNTVSNDLNTAAAPSRNIVRKVYTEYTSPASFAPRIYSSREENLGEAFQEEIGGTLYYAGSYGTAGNTERTNQLFLIRDVFNPLTVSGNQQNTQTTNDSINQIFGNTVVSIAQNSVGNIYIASTIQDNNVNEGPSKLFKFSSSGGLLSAEPIEFNSSRFYNIRKIKISELDDKIIILSSLEFENNARAVGLMKINF